MFLNLLFLCILFPLSLIFYYLIPNRVRPITLLLISILFLILWQKENCLLFLGLILITSLFGKRLATMHPNSTATRLLLGLHDGLYLFALFALRPPQEWTLFQNVLYPVGISILALQSISYVHRIAQRTAPPFSNSGQLALSFCFFPKLLFGPVSSNPLQFAISRKNNAIVEPIGKGLRQIVYGLARSVLLSGQFYLIAQQMKSAFGTQDTVFFTWMYQLISFLYVYYQITGYTQIASGLAACYGYHLPHSFRLPLWNKNFSVFLCNWNRTVVRWFLRAFGAIRPNNRTYWLRLLLAYAALGWFCRGRLTAFLWGILTGLILLSCRQIQRKWKMPTVLEWGLTILIGILGWSLFCSDTFTEVFTTWGLLFGTSRDLVSYQDLYFLQNSIWLLLIAAGDTTGFYRIAKKWILKRSWTTQLFRIAAPIGELLLFLLSLIAIVGDAVPPLFFQW